MAKAFQKAEIMKFKTDTIGDCLIFSIHGEIDRRAAGPLYDALVDVLEAGWTRLIVDLSDAGRLTRAGVRGLVVAGKLMQGVRGEMRLAGPDAAARALLTGLGFGTLLKCEDDVDTALASICRAEAVRLDRIARSHAEVMTAPARPCETPRTGTDGRHMTFARYFEIAQVEHARKLLSEGALTTDQVAAACGFETPEILRQQVQEHLGLSLTDLARRRRGQLQGSRQRQRLLS
ncbi:MAG: hypothetical protein CMH12_19360 [Maritimibacter sp.]|nr:hypothetical protein [Maritimibacter sp.]